MERKKHKNFKVMKKLFLTTLVLFWSLLAFSQDAKWLSLNELAMQMVYDRMSQSPFSEPTVKRAIDSMFPSNKVKMEEAQENRKEYTYSFVLDQEIEVDLEISTKDSKVTSTVISIKQAGGNYYYCMKRLEEAMMTTDYDCPAYSRFVVSSSDNLLGVKITKSIRTYESGFKLARIYIRHGDSSSISILYSKE
jgi:hypothetical protein